MVFERPLIDRGDILDALGPIRQRAESSYRWLRQNRLVSPGIPLRPREDGVFHGSAIVLSALNRDAIVATRVNERGLAQELSQEAARLEEGLAAWIESAEFGQGPGARDHDHPVIEAILSLPDRPSERWSRRTLRWAQDDAPELLDGLLPLAADLTNVRDRLTLRLPLAQVTMSRGPADRQATDRATTSEWRGAVCLPHKGGPSGGTSARRRGCGQARGDLPRHGGDDPRPSDRRHSASRVPVGPPNADPRRGAAR